MTAEAAPLPPRRSLLSLWLLVLICGLPPLAGWILYLNPTLLPQSRGNHGELVVPTRPLPAAALLRPDGAPATDADLRGRWLLTLVAEGRCAAGCQQRLDAAARVRRALGGPGRQVGTLLLLLPTAAGEPAQLPAGEFDARPLLARPGAAAALRQLLTLAPGDAAQRRYLVDPRGQLIMAYDTRVHDDRQLLEDLEQLLKATRNWNLEGNHGNQ